jgi:hypothetical protein
MFNRYYQLIVIQHLFVAILDHLHIDIHSKTFTSFFCALYFTCFMLGRSILSVFQSPWLLGLVSHVKLKQIREVKFTS